ncbi:hypothetical protein V1520DRAFT_347625 [Lipomyces starkeyi]|uniref:Centrosomin N-terminal motif 1 domain-containing protein n=1 Tax=Lipomyces starkeyi NRRL Y-11557 TaxID=675824 RepID=A0A1E3QGQ4_LIPST|nr:hypothetical protein LIPSTDRAFT_143331 [Lipomyces starkeyi NRRL Y-11557]
MSTRSVDATDSDHGKLNNIENHFFGDREASFVAPDGYGPKRTTTAQPNAIATNERQQRTPANRHIFKDLTNQSSSASRREFTPLLQSAVRNNSMKKVASVGMPQEPDIIAKSPGLPANGDDDGDFSTSMEGLTRASIRHAVQLESENSTPIPRRGVPGADNMLTLREQEKAIDEMQKENFGLKLRIFFLMQQLKATTPEALSGTLQQNVEMKAEQVAMKTELTKLKKQLTESESKVAQLTANIAADLSAQEVLTDDEKVRLEQLLMDNKKTNDELFDARIEIQNLQQEMDEYRAQLEESDGEHAEVEELKATIEQLEEKVDRLKEESQSLREELDAKDRQLEQTFQELKDADLQIQELQETIDYLHSADKGQMTSDKSNVDMTEEKRKYKEEVEEMELRLEELATELQKAQADAADSKNRADRATSDFQELLNGGHDDPLDLLHLDRLKSEVKSLVAKNDLLEEELKQIRDSRESEKAYRAEIDNANQQIESLKLTVNQLKSVNEFGVDKPNMQELKQSHTKAVSLEKRVRDQDAEIAELTLKLKESESEGTSRTTAENEMLKAYQMQIDDEAELKEDAQRKADTLSKKNISLNKQMQVLQRELREKDTELSALQSQLKANAAKSFKNDRDKIKAQLKASQIELETFKEKATFLQNDLHSAIKKLEHERDDILDKHHATKKELEANKISFKMKLETLSSRSSKKDQALQALVHSQNQVFTLEREISKLAKQHKGELKGLAMQIQYLRAKGDRERGFRADSAFLKKFFLLQISSFESCNKASLYMLEQMGIYPEKKYHNKRPTLKAVAHMMIAAIRMRNLRNGWMVQQKTKGVLAMSLQNLKCERNIHEFRS